MRKQQKNEWAEGRRPSLAQKNEAQKNEAPKNERGLRTRVVRSSVVILLALGFALLGGLVGIQDSRVTEAREVEADQGPRGREQALIELGRRLFFDPTVSRSGKRSCASCHDPDHGFSDPMRVSPDDIGRTLRHSQTLLDTAMNPTAHWDGVFQDVEELALARLRPVRGQRGRGGSNQVILGLGVQPGAGGGFEIKQLGIDAPTDTSDDVVEEEEKPKDKPDRYGRGGRGAFSGPSGAEPPTTREGDKKDEKSDAAPESEGAQPASGEKADGAAGATPATPPTRDRPEIEDGAGATTPEADRLKPEEDDPSMAGADDSEADESDFEDFDGDTTQTRTFDPTKLPRVADVIEQGERYAAAFRAAFGSPSVSTSRLARAIGAYCRTIESTPAPFDRWRAGDAAAISEEAQRGFQLFIGRARCSTCHLVEGKHPLFTDFEFHNTGVARNTLVRRARLSGARQIDTKALDLGREGVSTRAKDRSHFKTPTLRDVARRGPYMHNGMFKTLEEVVSYYAKGASRDPARSELVHGFRASKRDIEDIVAFLHTLSGDERPGLAKRPWKLRAGTTRLTFQDERGRPLVNMPVVLMPEGDVLPREQGERDGRIELVTDEKGRIEYVPFARTHTRVTLPLGLEARSGNLVPDCVRKAVMTVPVDEEIEVIVRFKRGAAAPKELAAVHIEAMRLPGHPLPRTLLARTSVVDTASGPIARYKGWRRVDVSGIVRLRIPGLALKRGPRLDLAAARLHRAEVMR